MYTLFEKLSFMLIDYSSSNTILHYFENKNWFAKYKTGSQIQYYKIPYHIWRSVTLINLDHIKVLSKLINQFKGEIYTEGENEHLCVVISASPLEYFEKREPKFYIYDICKKYSSTIQIIKFLDEFYSYELQDYYDDISKVRYSIDYSEWIHYFDINDIELIELNKHVLEGTIKVIYKDEQPYKVDISY
jgi:hypothetical protein